MDNKTLALLGLGAALTAFLSHQSYQNTGSAFSWTGLVDPPAAEVIASSDDSSLVVYNSKPEAAAYTCAAGECCLSALIHTKKI